MVYLAEDPELERQVAIKTLHLQDALQDESELDQLLVEARAVSKLQDDNIVSIFDIGRQGTEAYLVLEYIEGQSLDRTIRQNPPMGQKLAIIKDMVSGVAAAHAKDIIHCDLKPANILIQQGGKAKVADFGLALLTEGSHGGDNELYGTPQYMAPEYIETSKHQKVSDVFSVGLVCYELLTGKTAFSGDDVYQVINAIAHSEVTPPSEVNPEVNEGLNAIIMKALEKDPATRYGNAGELLQALNDYMALSDGGSSSVEGEDATVQFLLRRMRHKKDFPMFSRTISTVNRASSSDTESLTSISNAILKDFSLTNKILRLVNSVHYNRSGQKITTISRAVVMMGINPIRTIAASIMLFEHMQNKAQESKIKDEAVQALFSAMVANELASASMPKNHEEAFLCALLQHLGKMLVSYYLHEEYEAIEKLMVDKQCSEDAAVQEVLGVGYAKLGAAVAREWGFPDLLANSLKPMNFDAVPEKGSAEQQLQVISQFSHALTNTLTLPKSKQAAAMKTLTEQFSDALKLDDKKVSALIDNSTRELTDFSRLIEYNFGKSSFYKQMVGDIVEETDTDNSSSESAAQSGVTVLDEDTTQFSTDSKQSLTDGIQDISNALTGDFSINQIMQMILETIFRAFPGSRVMLCLKDGKTSSIRGRFGYGDDVNDIIDQFVIPLTYQNDVFHVAFKNNVDIRIDDTLDAKISNKIPDWYHDNVGARSFTIFPIVIKNSPIALIYIDSAGDKPITINDEQLGLLKTLRNQAILAIKSMS